MYVYTLKVRGLLLITVKYIYTHVIGALAITCTCTVVMYSLLYALEYMCVLDYLLRVQFALN